MGSFPGLEVVETSIVEQPCRFPYVPGLLAFREGPSILAAFRRLRARPDLLVFDGQGIAHPRRFPAARVVAMEPAEAAMLCGEMPCCHAIEGVAGGFLPPLLREAPLDGEVAVRSTEAMAMTRRLNRELGLLVGTSSGANVAAALRVARDLGPGRTVVTLICDRAERYFSTSLFEEARSDGGGRD